MVGDQLPDTRGHLAAVAEDVADEVPADPVVDTDVLVLAAPVAYPALRDSPQTCPAGQVQEDPSVRRLEADREAGGIVAVDDPSPRGHQIALEGGELLLV